MDLYLNEKIVVITGGAAGIGKGIASSFVKEGAKVILLDTDKQGLEKTKYEFNTNGYEVDTEVVDVCNFDIFAQCVYGIYEKYGSLDIFVNNAGGGDSMPLMQSTVKDFQYVMDWNFTSLFVGTQAAANCMKRCGGGVILNGSSFNAILPTAGKSVYSASKRAILTLTAGFAAELAKDNIRVVGYIPGFIVAGHAWEKLATMGKEKLEKEIICHRLGQVEDVGDVVAFLASDRASYINGTFVEITGGKYAVQNPNWAYEEFIKPEDLKKEIELGGNNND